MKIILEVEKNYISLECIIKLKNSIFRTNKKS